MSRNGLTIVHRAIILYLVLFFFFLADGLGVERKEEVDRTLKKMRNDVDRDVRMLAGGEERLDVISPQDSVAVSHDKMDEPPRNILF